MTTDPSLLPPPILTDPGAEYMPDRRLWQGIPTLERAANGQLWAAWYSGGEGEGPENYVQVVTSDDDGFTWSDPVLVVDPPGRVRAYDECLWHDPLGRLWLFWAQSGEWFNGRCGVWAIRTEDASGPSATWSAPRRLCNGIMMNKPTVLSTGEWLLPAAVWANTDPKCDDMAAERFSNVIVSENQGETWQRRGGADVPGRTFDEHMVVERRDGSLWMLVRTKVGVGESTSTDAGRTWSPGKPSGIAGPNSRFFIRRLRSGRLLLVNHHRFTGRSHMTALLSEDDGRTWIGGLLLDERNGVSYPDGVQTDEGLIYVIYDRDRQGDGDILMAVFTEDDVLEGEPARASLRLKHVIHRLPRDRDEGDAS